MRHRCDLAARLGLVLVLQACGNPPGPATVGTRSPLYPGSALGAPAPVPSGVRGAAYLTSVAAELQPPWAQFLE
ncbi:MAG: hypothetical protein H0T79_16875, partial [Deltaproteobacteria bacterium]|nr:hypothetical protein [Deltaproteobacteria bacterium]